MAIEHGPNASGVTAPIWYDGFDAPRHDPLAEDARADVCVVGAGIAGLTAAYLLAREGKRVIVLDEKLIGGGETGRTSAHLASALDDRFSHLERTIGLDATRLHHQSHAAAIDEIERTARDNAIDCDFARLDGLLFRAEGDDGPDLDEEFAAARRAGVAGVELLDAPPLKCGMEGPCVRFPEQGRFHPLRYLVGVAQAAERLGVRIHTGSRVTGLKGDGPVVATLDSGRTVTADAGVAATNVPSPINNWTGIYTKVAPYRTFVVGIEIDPGAVGDALYWDTADPYRYVRVHREGDRAILLVGGEDHKTGQPGDGLGDERFARLEAWARGRFGVTGRVVCRWSGQVSEPDDGVAFIGRAPTSDHKACFVITGDSGMGLTHGTLGAMLVADLILGRPNPWEEIYAPARKPWHAVRTFAKENINAAAQLVDYLKPGEARSADDVEPGEGAVIRDGAHRIAVHRDAQGNVHKCSAVCTHLRCVVRWNSVEKSWDCPCHGSRFDPEGKVITGPAIEDLGPASADES